MPDLLPISWVVGSYEKSPARGRLEITVWFSAMKLCFKPGNQTAKRISLWCLPRAHARGYGYAAPQGAQDRDCNLFYSFLSRISGTKPMSDWSGSRSRSESPLKRARWGWAGFAVPAVNDRPKPDFVGESPLKRDLKKPSPFRRECSASSGPSGRAQNPAASSFPFSHGGTRDNRIVHVPRAFVEENRFQAAVAQAAQRLAPHVVSLIPALGDDWSGEPAVFFMVILSDAASRRDQLLSVSNQVSEAIVEQVQPLEQWDVLPYFNFRSQSEQTKLNQPALV